LLRLSLQEEEQRFSFLDSDLLRWQNKPGTLEQHHHPTLPLGPLVAQPLLGPPPKCIMGGQMMPPCPSMGGACVGYVLLLLHQTSCNAVLGLASPQPNKGQATSCALLWALAGAGLNNRAHFAPGKQSGYNDNLYDT